MIRENLLQRGDGKKILLLGMGNFLRGDDGFGPWVIRHLKDKTSLMLLDAGANPENMFGPLRRLRPEEIIIVDAVSLDAPPGSLHWLDPRQIDNVGLSTHAPSLDLFITFLQANRMDAPVHIIGVVPSQLNMAGRLSPEVQEAAHAVVALIAELFPPENGSAAVPTDPSSNP